MGKVIISVDGVSKRYQIGHTRDGSDGLRHHLERAIRAPFVWRKNVDRKESAGKRDFWALQDLNFEVMEGEVLGIIGRNGSGKSTLLKILSRITEPTTGRIKLRGRVASLLEVGTGFHPELSGRENIFLNGAILGMCRNEIRRKFDEIVEFSEIGDFVDTPVKRYSSGMYVRLAFSVAAHLEPDVLIIDEILAVGDAAFQKKCLGKMEEASTQGGRTIIVVSHQDGVISGLCNRCLLLDKGRLHFDGTTSDALDRYVANTRRLSSLSLADRTDRQGKGLARVTSLQFTNSVGLGLVDVVSGSLIKIRVRYEVRPQIKLSNCRVSITFIKDLSPILVLSTDLVDRSNLELDGIGEIEFQVDKWPLSLGDYQVSAFIASDMRKVQDWIDDATEIHVSDGDFYGSGKTYHEGWSGKCVLVEHTWQQMSP